MSVLSGKKILIGVSGSIAAYKAVYLVRTLQKEGAIVRVMMTASATQFVTALTFEAITHSPVYSSLVLGQSWNNHIDISLWADAYIIAPATAHTIAKLAHGLADDMVSAAYLAARCPIFIAPSMDVDMWHHLATQANISTLSMRGAKLIPVGNGYLASGLSGEGRMAEPDEIIDYLQAHLSAQLTLKGIRVLVTAGPTYESIDPVRFIGNASSGKMGIALADALAAKGAVVSLILGPSNHSARNVSVHTIRVRTAVEMMQAAEQLHSETDVSIFSAAVADYRPALVAKEKIKKTDNQLDIRLVKNPDIAFELGMLKKKSQIHIGFALESTSGEKYAREKLKKKNFDFLVLNSLQDAGAGFATDTNKITVFFKDNKSRKFELKSKSEVAQDIIFELEKLIKKKK